MYTEYGELYTDKSGKFRMKFTNLFKINFINCSSFHSREGTYLKITV